MIVVSSPLTSPRSLIQAMLAWVTDRVREPIILDLKKCFRNVGHCFTLNTMLNIEHDQTEAKPARIRMCRRANKVYFKTRLSQWPRVNRIVRLRTFRHRLRFKEAFPPGKVRGTFPR